MIKGSQLIDGGNFVFTKEEKEEFEKLNAEEQRNNGRERNRFTANVECI